MRNVLNPKLYGALDRYYHEVLVANVGVAYVAAQVPALSRPGGTEERIMCSGEYYRVNCHRCGDTRKRLWISHMFNVSTNGNHHLHLAHCFNERCFGSLADRLDLLDRIYPFGYRATQQLTSLAPAWSSPDSGVLPAEQIARLPAVFHLGDAVAAPACQYLHHRGFDLGELSNVWGVTYCTSSLDPPPQIYNRIVIPIYGVRPRITRGSFESDLKGWQARVIHDDGASGPKYLSMTGMKKSQLLYGLPQALQASHPAVVIVEGPTDVWRLGSNAVATLGKSISSQQIGLLVSHFAGRPLYVAFDRDATAEAEAAAAAIRTARRQWDDPAPVYVASPPHGADDIGEVDRDAAWQSIFSGARQPV